MRLAIQENLIPGSDFSEKVRKAEKWGFEGIEVWGMDLKARVEDIKRHISKSKVQVSTICAGYRGSLLGAKKEERDTAVGDIKQLLSLGAELGTVGLIVVPIFGPARIPDLSPWKEEEDIEEELLCHLLKEIGDIAEKTGCFCLIEPLNRYETHLVNTVAHASKIVERVGSPGVKIMADFFHMSIEEKNISRDKSPIQLEKQFGKHQSPHLPWRVVLSVEIYTVHYRETDTQVHRTELFYNLRPQMQGRNNNHH